MTTFTAGKFTLEISEPYPMWITIATGNYVLRGFTHRDLVDLRHVVDRAIAEAERKHPGETK